MNDFSNGATSLGWQ